MPKTARENRTRAEETARRAAIAARAARNDATCAEEDADRARRADEALDAHQRAQDPDPEYERDHEAVAALLRDVRHLCDREGIDYDAADVRAADWHAENVADATAFDCPKRYGKECRQPGCRHAKAGAR